MPSQDASSVSRNARIPHLHNKIHSRVSHYPQPSRYRFVGSNLGRALLPQDNKKVTCAIAHRIRWMARSTWSWIKAVSGSWWSWRLLLDNDLIQKHIVLWQVWWGNASCEVDDKSSWSAAILNAGAMIGMDVTSLHVCTGYSQAKNDFLFEKVCPSNARCFLFKRCNSGICCLAEAPILPARYSTRPKHS